jgi:hypothetical protein
MENIPLLQNKTNFVRRRLARRSTAKKREELEAPLPLFEILFRDFFSHAMDPPVYTERVGEIGTPPPTLSMPSIASAAGFLYFGNFLLEVTCA